MTPTAQTSYPPPPAPVSPMEKSPMLRAQARHRAERHRARIREYLLTGTDPIEGDQPTIRQLAERIDWVPEELLLSLHRMRSQPGMVSQANRLREFHAARVFIRLAELAQTGEKQADTLKAQELFWTLARELRLAEPAAEKELPRLPTELDSRKVLELLDAVRLAPPFAGPSGHQKERN